MNPLRNVLATLALCGALGWNWPAVAHEGPEHEIEELTERMKTEGESADLLLQRAIEFNILRKSAEAIRDLQRALVFEPKSPGIHLELSRAYFASGKTNEAFDTATRGLESATGGPKAALLMVRADIARARKDYPKALEYVERAIREETNNVESYLARSQLQQLLALKKDRIAGLEEAMAQTGSGLLEAEYVDALIDGGRLDQALVRIQAELDDARLRGTWLIRRARVYLAQREETKAQSDLKAALEELNERLGRSASDPLLLLDRALTHELLGKDEEAKKDYEAARAKGVSDERVAERIRALGGGDNARGGNRRRDRQ